jgi:hypothetical protein
VVRRQLCTTAAALLQFIVMTTISGCASLVTSDFSKDDPAPLASPSPRTEVRTIALETRWVRHAVDDPVVVEELWDLVDEQALPRAVRERLASNGLRAGLVSWPLPAALASRFAYVHDSPDEDAQLPVEDQLLPDVSRQTLRLLPGRHSEVVAAPTQAEMVVLVRDMDHLGGSTYQHATAVFELTAETAAAGETTIRLVPVIKHGESRREWIGEEGVFRLEAGQCRDHLAECKLSLSMSADEMLVITAAGPPSSTVGDAFFRGRGLPRTPQQTLAIRPLSRHTDPVFATPGD